MAPATIAGASQNRSANGRRGGWDRDSVIDAIQEWVATYGEPPRAADWNPSSAKWSGQQWRVERYRAGRADGSAWPALNSAKRPFGGSLNVAVRASGFEPARPGPRRRGSVDPAQADRAVMSPEGRAMVQAALAQAQEAEKRVAVLEARLERASKANHKESKDQVKTKVVRERVVDDAAVARAERRAAAAEAKAASAAAQAKEQVASARMDAAEARQAAKRLASRLERGAATIAELREDRREVKAVARRDAERLAAAERALDVARAEARAARAEAEAAHALRAAPAATEPASSDAAAVRAAQAEAAASRHAARTAEARASAAERELRETVAAITGEARRLTADELAELRADGPSGPAVLAAALKALARARARDGSPTELQAALLDVAGAAVTWRERT